MIRITLMFFAVAVVGIVVASGVGAIGGGILWVFCTLLGVSKNDTTSAALGVGGTVAGIALLFLAITLGVWFYEHTLK